MSDRIAEIHCCCGMPYTAHNTQSERLPRVTKFDGFTCPGFRPRPFALMPPRSPAPDPYTEARRRGRCVI